MTSVCAVTKTSIKLSPGGGANDTYNTSKEGRIETYKHFVSELDKLNIAYIQLMRYNPMLDDKHGGEPQGFEHDLVATYGPLIKNAAMIVNGGYDGESGTEAINQGAKAVVFGWNWIANPDFYERLQSGKELSQPDMQVSTMQ